MPGVSCHALKSAQHLGQHVQVRPAPGSRPGRDPRPSGRAARPSDGVSGSAPTRLRRGSSGLPSSAAAGAGICAIISGRGHFPAPATMTASCPACTTADTPHTTGAPFTAFTRTDRLWAGARDRQALRERSRKAEDSVTFSDETLCNEHFQPENRQQYPRRRSFQQRNLADW